MSFVTSLKKKVAVKYYQYELTFALYMLEPWEKFIFNVIVVLFASLLLYSSFTKLPVFVGEVVNKTQYYMTSLPTGVSL